MDKLESVFKPWLQSFLSDGTYDQVYEYINGNELGRVTIAQKVIYPWSNTGVYGPIKRESYLDKAKSIAEAEIRGRHAEAVRLSDLYLGYIRNEELWSAILEIQGRPYYQEKYYGLRVARWPLRGAGFAFAWGMAMDMGIPLKGIKSADELLAKTHPEVILGLSEQIEGGGIWQSLKQGLEKAKDRRYRSPEPMNRLAYDQLCEEQRQEYLVKRGKQDWIPDS